MLNEGDGELSAKVEHGGLFSVLRRGVKNGIYKLFGAGLGCCREVGTVTTVSQGFLHPSPLRAWERDVFLHSGLRCDVPSFIEVGDIVTRVDVLLSRASLIGRAIISGHCSGDRELVLLV